MNLREYLFRNRLTIKEFADQIGYARGYISQVMGGRKEELPRLTKMVNMHTKGKVTQIYSGPETDSFKDESDKE